MYSGVITKKTSQNDYTQVVRVIYGNTEHDNNYKNIDLAFDCDTIRQR